MGNINDCCVVLCNVSISSCRMVANAEHTLAPHYLQIYQTLSAFVYMIMLDVRTFECLTSNNTLSDPPHRG